MKQFIFLISLTIFSYNNLSTFCYEYITAQIFSKDVKIYVNNYICNNYICNNCLIIYILVKVMKIKPRYA